MIQINDIQHHIPQTWDDLTLHQLMTCYQIVMDQRINHIFEAEEQIQLRRIEITKAILNLDDQFMKSWEKDAGSDFFQELHQVADTVSAFAFEPVDDDKYQLSLNRYKCPYPELEYGELFFYSPADSLNNITLYELGMSFRSFEAFAQNGKEEDLHRLLAILYRPGKPDTPANVQSDYEGDRRLPLYKHETTIDRRMKTMAMMPVLVSQVIVFWFASCRQKIISSFPNIFEAPEGEKGGNDYSWAGVILNLADGIVNEEKVSNTNYGTALVYLSMLEDRRKKQELEARLAKQRK